MKNSYETLELLIGQEVDKIFNDIGRNARDYKDWQEDFITFRQNKKKRLLEILKAYCHVQDEHSRNMTTTENVVTTFREIRKTPHSHYSVTMHPKKLTYEVKGDTLEVLMEYE